MSPQRIQLRRTKGWRKPEGAIVVARPTRWGNPFLVSDAAAAYPSLTVEQCRGLVVADFRDLIRCGGHLTRRVCGEVRHLTYPTLNEIVAVLAGRDVGCWCSLGQPCHGDVLLEIANGGTQ